MTTEIENAIKVLTDAMQDTSAGSYAHSWHCNIAMSHLDTMTRAGYKIGKIEREAANQGAAHFMRLVFGVKTNNA